MRAVVISHNNEVVARTLVMGIDKGIEVAKDTLLIGLSKEFEEGIKWISTYQPDHSHRATPGRLHRHGDGLVLQLEGLLLSQPRMQAGFIHVIDLFASALQAADPLNEVQLLPLDPSGVFRFVYEMHVGFRKGDLVETIEARQARDAQVHAIP
jgi:hypothetical protein